MKKNDVENHWSKDTVNDMGSRLNITRAETAGMIQRLLKKGGLI